MCENICSSGSELGSDLVLTGEHNVIDSDVESSVWIVLSLVGLCAVGLGCSFKKFRDL